MSFVWRARAHALATEMSHTLHSFPPLQDMPDEVADHQSLFV